MTLRRTLRKRRAPRLLAMATALALLPLSVAAADFTPDTGFGSGGKTVLSSSKVDWFNDVTAVSDGYLAAGAWRANSVVVAKYDTSGVRDSTFGDHGRLVVDLGFSARGVQIIERPSGDFLVTAATDRGFALMVVTADGKLNRDYGRRGLVKQRTSGSYWNIVTVIDGERRAVVAVGERTSGKGYTSRIHVWRFTRAGNPDRSFRDGDVTASPERVNDVQGIATDRADRVWLVTYQYTSRNPKAGMSLVRISTNGATVRTLHRMSVWEKDATLPIGLTRVGPATFLVGVTGINSPRLGAVAFGAEGDLVRSYGDRGVLRTRCDVPCYPFDQHVDDQGRLIMVGGGDFDRKSRWDIDDGWASRFTASGRRDGTFMNGWEGRLPISSGFDAAYGVDVDDAGRLVFVGRTRNDAYIARWAE